MVKKKVYRKPKVTCVYCTTWHELPVNDAREKEYIKICHDKEITADTPKCESFEPHPYFLCPDKSKQRLHLEVCYHRCETKTCSKWKRCGVGKIVKHIIDTYEENNE